jgi:hypothetical protein
VRKGNLAGPEIETAHRGWPDNAPSIPKVADNCVTECGQVSAQLVPPSSDRKEVESGKTASEKSARCATDDLVLGARVLTRERKRNRADVLLHEADYHCPVSLVYESFAECASQRLLSSSALGANQQAARSTVQAVNRYCTNNFPQVRLLCYPLLLDD